MKISDKKSFEAGLGKGFKAGWYAAHHTLAEGLKKTDHEYAAWLVQRGERPPEIDVEELPPGSPAGEGREDNQLGKKGGE